MRQLEAFVAVAAELHFGRAAERLHMAAPTLSELIRRLERELGAPLFTRTTRQVALTSVGAELLTRSKVILDEVAAAKAAIRRVADGEEGTVRLGITPPAAPVLAPHLISLFTAKAPQVTVALQRMWLPTLLDAVAAGQAMVCAQADQERFGAEHLGGDPGRFGDRAAGEGHVDVAGNDSVEKLGQPHPLQFDSYLWCFGGEQADQMRGEHRGGGRGDAQPHGACLAASDAAYSGLGGGDLVENDLRAGEQFGAGAGDGNPPGRAGE